MKKEYYILYVLIIKKQKAIKIGITAFDRYEARFKEIETAFGKIDKINSIYFTSTSLKEIKNFEKSLHLLFWKDKKELKTKGSGYTEFFNQKIFDNIKKIIPILNKQTKSNLIGPIYFNKTKISFIYIIFFIAISSISIYYFDLFINIFKNLKFL